MIYLDHHATSPMLPNVHKAVEAWFGRPCNPSSVHAAGRRAAAAVDRAREQVADLVCCDPRQIIFTSGATEANHLWFAARSEPVWVGATEHPSVPAATGLKSILKVGEDGIHVPIPSALPGLSVMAVNHETGVISNLAELRHQHAGWFHVDATAALGRIPLSFDGLDALTLSAHKIGGPMGVGALVARDLELPAVFNGTQQRGRRGGTMNVPGIVGLGQACAIAKRDFSVRRECWFSYRARVRDAAYELGGRVVPGESPSVINLIFPGLPAETIVQALDLRGICVSAGSACASGSIQASPVLKAMQDPQPAGGVRVSFGWNTRASDVDALLDALPAVLDGLRLFL